jgi:hypothetical protein
MVGVGVVGGGGIFYVKYASAGKFLAETFATTATGGSKTTISLFSSNVECDNCF